MALTKLPDLNPPVNPEAAKWSREVAEAIRELAGEQRTQSSQIERVQRSAEGASQTASAANETATSTITVLRAIPAAPENVAVASQSASFGANGLPVTQVTLTWDPITADDAGQTLTPDAMVTDYEVWDNVNTAPKFLAVISATNAESESIKLDLDSGKTYNLYVRGRTATTHGAFSEPLVLLTNAPTTLGLPPTAPTLTTELGVVSAKWDGMLISGGPVAKPNWIDYVFAETGTSSSGPWTRAGQPLRAAGTVVVTGTPGDTVWVRFKSVTTAGVAGDPSTTASIVVQGVDLGSLESDVADAIAQAEAAAEAAQTTADGKNKIWRQDAEPPLTGNTVGDLWFDTNDGNKIYTWNGSAWSAQPLGSNAIASGAVTSTQLSSSVNTTINNAASQAAQAQTDASAALTAANGKNKVWYQTSQPPTTGNTVGDTWFDTDDNNRIYRWTGSAWSSTQLGSNALADASITNAKIVDGTIQNAKIGNLDAGKLTTGTLSADRIGAKTVTVDKLLVGDFTNAASGSDFEGTHPWSLGTGLSVDTAQARSGTKSLKIAGTATGSATLQTEIITAPGEQWYIEFWAYRDASWNGTGSNSKLRIGNQTGSLIGDLNYSATSVPATTWTKRSGVYTMPAGTTKMQVTLVRDATAGNIWLDDIVIRRMTAGELIVDGAVTASKIAAGSITAGSAIIADGAITNAKIADAAITAAKIEDATITDAKIGNIDAGKISTGYIASERIDAGTIGADQIAAGAVTTEKVAAGAITTAGLAAGAVTANEIAAGTITASKLDAGVGGALNLSANQSITFLVGEVSDVQDEVGAVADGFEEMRTFYDFGTTGAIVGAPDSPFAVAIRNDRIEMLESGVPVSYWNAGQMHVESLVGVEVELGNHKLEKYGADTVIRAL